MKRVSVSGWVSGGILLFWYMLLVPWVIDTSKDPVVILGIIALPATILPFFRAVFLRSEDE